MSSDERRRGSFPLTKAVLWSRVPQGAALQLKLSAPSVKVSARSIQVLAKEAQLCMSEDKVFRGFVTGDLDFNVAHHCFEFHARRFDPGRELKDGSLVPAVPVTGQVNIPVHVRNERVFKCACVCVCLSHKHSKGSGAFRDAPTE